MTLHPSPQHSKQRMILWNMTKESNSSVICPWSLNYYKGHVYFINSMMKWHLINLSTPVNLLNHFVMENVHMMRKLSLFHALPTSSLPENLGGQNQTWAAPALTSGKKLSTPCSTFQPGVHFLMCNNWYLTSISSLRNQHKFLFHFLWLTVFEKIYSAVDSKRNKQLLKIIHCN